jgi:hypothetical protein
MEALIDDVNAMALNMMAVVVVGDDDDDSFDKEVPTYPEDHQTEVNVHLNKIRSKFGAHSSVLLLPAVLCSIGPPGIG